MSRYCKGLGQRRAIVLFGLTKWQVKNLALTTAAVFCLFVFTYILIWIFVMPLQRSLLPDISKFACLLFLPHGIRVLSTSLLGWRAVPGLVLAGLACNFFFWGLRDPAMLIIAALINGCVCWVVFEGLLRLRVNAFYRQLAEESPPFHTLLLAGLLTSAVNAFLMTSLAESVMGPGRVMSTFAAFLTGDVTGLLAAMAAARYTLPLLERFND